MTAENPPAFPHGTRELRHDSYSGRTEDQSVGFDPGMSLRDYFAGIALGTVRGLHGMPAHIITESVSECYRIADAMLSARTPAPATGDE